MHLACLSMYIVYNETRDLNETIIILTVHWLLAMIWRGDIMIPPFQCPLAACHLVKMSADVLFMFLCRRLPLSFLLPPRRNVKCLSLTPPPDNVYHVSPDFDGATSLLVMIDPDKSLTSQSPPLIWRFLCPLCSY